MSGGTPLRRGQTFSECCCSAADFEDELGDLSVGEIGGGIAGDTEDPDECVVGGAYRCGDRGDSDDAFADGNGVAVTADLVELGVEFGALDGRRRPPTPWPQPCTGCSTTIAKLNGGRAGP